MNPPNLSASTHELPAPAPYLAPDIPRASEPRGAGITIPPAARQAALALWRGKWLVVLAGLAAGAVTAARMIPKPRTYTSNASFILQGVGGPNPSSIASQFGIALGAGQAGPSAGYYIELLGTREILGRIAVDSFCDPCRSGRPRQRLTTILGLDGLDSLRRMDAAVRALRGAIHAGVSRMGIIELSVTMSSPTLSQQVARATLEQLSRFNVEGRQSQAAAERRFTEQRLSEVQGELRAAEAQLQAFLQTNRIISSPELVIRKGRLEQEVDLRRQLYLTLARSYEQAKIDEVRDTPVLTVLDQPSYALAPNSRGLVVRTAFSAVYGGMTGAALVLGIAFYRDRRRWLA